MYWLGRDACGGLLSGHTLIALPADLLWPAVLSPGLVWFGMVWCGWVCFGLVWFGAMVPALKFQLLRQMINEHVAANFLAFCLAGQEHLL